MAIESFPFSEYELFKHKQFRLLGHLGLRRADGHLPRLWRYTMLDLQINEGETARYLIDSVAPMNWLYHRCEDYRKHRLAGDRAMRFDFEATKLTYHIAETHVQRSEWKIDRADLWKMSLFVRQELKGKNQRPYMLLRFELAQRYVVLKPTWAFVQRRHAVCKGEPLKFHFQVERMPLEQVAFDLARHHEKTDKVQRGNLDAQYRRLRAQGYLDSARQTQPQN